MSRNNQESMTRALEQALAAQDRLHGCTRNQIQQANLIHAVQRTMPASHTEYALAVWAGTRPAAADALVEEYCRRRDGSSSQLFDHPLLSLHGWCMPDTLRLLVFREQLEVLAKQLTGNRDGRGVVRGICRYEVAGKGISQAEFCGLVDPANGLSGGDIALFYDYIRERYAEALPFAWCFTIAERATSNMMASA